MKEICAHFVCVTSSHTEHFIPTLLKKSCPGSDAHSQPAHRVSGWKSPCAQRGQIWYRNTAGKGGSKGQYWYGKHCRLGKSLRGCRQLLVIVRGSIQAQVMLVCVTCPELKRQVYLLLISAFILFLWVMVGLGIALISYQFAEAHMENPHMFTLRILHVANYGRLCYTHSHITRCNITCSITCRPSMHLKALLKA